MSNKTGNWILLGMVLGAVLGALGGYYLGDFFIEIEFLGTLFLNALKMIVVPLIVASMIVGVTSLGDIRRLGRTTGKTLLYYLATTGFAVLIGIILVNVIQPGVGIGDIGREIPEIVADTQQTTFSDFVVSLIPSNLIGAAAEGAVLPLIIFSLVFGGVLTSIGRRGRVVIDFFKGINTAIMKFVIIIIYFAPIGILALIGGIVAHNRGSLSAIASGLGMYSVTVIVGLLIHGVIILPLILKFFGKKNPFRYFLNMGQALATAFTTASSSASLPVTMECVEEKNRVNPKASAFVLPLGATINMDGTALYEAVAAIFIAQAINYPLSIEAQAVIFLTATLASIGAAAIPHAGLVTMVIVLSAVGLPLEGIGFIFAVDWFLDRCRTTVNVWGDSVGSAVIGETSEMQDRKKRSVRTDRTSKTSREKPGFDRSRDKSRARTNGRNDQRKQRPTGDSKSSRRYEPRSSRSRQRDTNGRNEKKRPAQRRDDAAKPRFEPNRQRVEPTKPRVEPTRQRSEPTKPRVEPTGPRVEPTKPRVEPTKSRVEPNKPRVESTGPRVETIAVGGKLKPETDELPYFPKDTIERELVKVRHQLDKMEDGDDQGGLPKGGEKTADRDRPLEKDSPRNDQSGKKNDILFPDIDKTDSEPIAVTADRSNHRESRATDGPSHDHDTEEIPTPVDREEKETTSEAASWGRGRKKRPSR